MNHNTDLQSTTHRTDPLAETVRRHGRLRKRAAVGAGLIGLAAVTTILGPSAFAGEGEGSDGPPQGPPGEPIADETAVPNHGSDANLIAEETGSFDQTMLTKFIPGRAFHAMQGDGVGDDRAVASSDCMTPHASSGGSQTVLMAGVELPDDARIRQVRFFGDDNDAGSDIRVQLKRTTVQMDSLVSFERSTTTVDDFTTSGTSISTAVGFAGEQFVELTGIPIGTTEHRFHSLVVTLENAAGADHALCGIEVDYQVASPDDAGEVFHPIEPMRVFDSRLDSFPESGPLAPNSSKTVSVADGYELDGTPIPAQANAVPAGATAVAYTVTAAGPTNNNFVSVTAGDATGFTTSSLNYQSGNATANSSTVEIADDRTITLWGGNGFGSANVILDITGYYAPADVPNMGN